MSVLSFRLYILCVRVYIYCMVHGFLFYNGIDFDLFFMTRNDVHELQKDSLSFSRLTDNVMGLVNLSLIEDCFNEVVQEMFWHNFKHSCFLSINQSKIYPMGN